MPHSKEVGLLADNGHLVPQPSQVDLFDVCAINEHTARCGVIKALYEADHGRP